MYPAVTLRVFVLNNLKVDFDNFVDVLVCKVGWGSSVGIATELRTGRSGNRIPVGAIFSAPVQTGPGARPATYTMRTVSFVGVKRPGAWR